MNDISKEWDFPDRTLRASGKATSSSLASLISTGEGLILAKKDARLSSLLILNLPLLKDEGPEVTTIGSVNTSSQL
jgi:hypothetical protein